MSGGVDSSLAAVLLREAGYDVMGFYFRMFGEDTGSAGNAAAVAAAAGIPFEEIDVRKEFREKIIDPFVREYGQGLTPNPCIMCNPEIKAEILLREADRNGCGYAAMGHYAEKKYDAEKDEYYLTVPEDRRKDQTYFLCRLSQEQLQRFLYPLGSMDKEDVRREAAARDIVVHDKKDSQEICFLAGRDYKDFLERENLEGEPGDIVLADGTVVGRHEGIFRYTTGQRKGLGLSMPRPCYVLGTDPDAGTVTVGPEEDLYSRDVYASDMSFMTSAVPAAGDTVLGKIRYGARPAEAEIVSAGEIFLFRFNEPQRAVTPGQTLALYRGERLIGGGTIMKPPVN